MLGALDPAAAEDPGTRLGAVVEDAGLPGSNAALAVGEIDEDVSTVAEKARDIAVLMSLGARSKQVRNIFIWQGLVVGGLGTFAGLVLGYSITWAADRFQLIQLDPEVYAIPYVPFHASWFDALWIVAATLAVSAAATLFPARAAARILPVEILRYE